MKLSCQARITRPVFDDRGVPSCPVSYVWAWSERAVASHEGKNMSTVSHGSKAHKPWQEKRTSIHFGSVDALIPFLQKHDVQEVCLKSLVSPTTVLQGESVRHSGVCVSACIENKPGTPIAYTTFLAASGAWLGQRSRLLYPKLSPHDPLRVLPIQEEIERLQQSLFFTLKLLLQAIPTLSVVLDAQWDVQDAWVGVAKGFVWVCGEWHRQEASPASVFSIS
jgi:hypothetical protein